MRLLVFVGLVLGFAAFGSAQTTAPSISVMSERQTISNGVVQMRGSVSIVIGDVRVTADEADVANREFSLRGNVHLSLLDLR